MPRGALDELRKEFFETGRLWPTLCYQFRPDIGNMRACCAALFTSDEGRFDERGYSDAIRSALDAEETRPEILEFRELVRRSCDSWDEKDARWGEGTPKCVVYRGGNLPDDDDWEHFDEDEWEWCVDEWEPFDFDGLAGEGRFSIHRPHSPDDDWRDSGAEGFDRSNLNDRPAPPYRSLRDRDFLILHRRRLAEARIAFRRLWQELAELRPDWFDPLLPKREVVSLPNGAIQVNGGPEDICLTAIRYLFHECKGRLCKTHSLDLDFWPIPYPLIWLPDNVFRVSGGIISRLESENAGEREQPADKGRAARPGAKRLTCELAMLKKLEEHPQAAKWTAAEWHEAIGFSTSTITSTKRWEALRGNRCYDIADNGAPVDRRRLRRKRPSN